MSLNKTFTGDVVNTGGGTGMTIQNGVVTLAKQADLAQATMVGRALSAGTGVPTALTPAQAAAIIQSGLWSQVEEVGAGPHADYAVASFPHHIKATHVTGEFNGASVTNATLGTFLLFSHQGTGYTQLTHNSTSTASNRLFNGRLGKNIRIFDNESAIYALVDTSTAGGTFNRWELIYPQPPYAQASDGATGDIVAHNGTNNVVVAGGNNADVVLRGNATFGSVSLAAMASQASNTIVANATGSAATPTAVAISADSLPARVGGNLVSHPFSTLAGEHLDYSAGSITWRKSRNVCTWWEDFECVNSTSSTGPHHFGNTVWITTALSSSGSVQFIAGEQNHPGICRVQTDAVDNSVFCIHRGGPDANSLWLSGDSIKEFEAVVRSNLATEKAFMIGFSSNTADVSTSGTGDIIAFMFDNDDTTLDVNIQCVVKETSAGSTPTITDSGISLASVHGSWMSLRIRQTTLGTVEFLINDSVVATSASRISDTELLNCGITVATRVASIAAIDVDYVYFESQPLTRF
jgi:hypothetical protein